MKKELLALVLFSFIFVGLASAGVLQVTNEHPFLINGNWIQAKQLQVGDLLTTWDGMKARITNIEEINQPVQVYNLEDDIFHNYVVSSDNLIVHNSIVPLIIRKYNRAGYPSIRYDSIYRLKEIQRIFLSDPGAPKIGIGGSKVRGFSVDTGLPVSAESDLDIYLIFDEKPCAETLLKYTNNKKLNDAIKYVSEVEHEPVAIITLEEAMKTNSPEVLRTIRENGGLIGLQEKGIKVDFKTYADTILLPD